MKIAVHRNFLLNTRCGAELCIAIFINRERSIAFDRTKDVYKRQAQSDAALELAADVSVLLTYHKLRDSLADEKGPKRALAAVLCQLGKRGYEKARARLPDADAEMVGALADLQTLEREKCASMDRAADASARMTAADVYKRQGYCCSPRSTESPRTCRERAESSMVDHS